MKKRILWLQNVVIPQIGEQIGLGKNYGGSWLASLFECFCNIGEVELAVVAPISMQHKPIRGKKICKVRFYSFYEKEIEKYNKSLEEDFKSIIADFQPDIVHIFGTEFPHTLAMIKAFNQPEKIVIHIQGLVSVCAKHYYANLPYSVIRKWTFHDLVKRDNIICQKRKFERRGKLEIEALQQVNHVMGRTAWDQACIKYINPEIQYHEVQEVMRKEFYEGCWNADLCEQYSIFVSQGAYPIKGLHIALEALKILKMKYPKIKLYVAGQDIFHCNGLKQEIRKTSYAAYIGKIIKKWNLNNNIVFLGNLNALEMKKRFLSSQVFISPSAIDNSPNSIGEAMLLGVPIIASDVGGVSSLIKHQRNGFLYQFDASYMLAFYIEQLFENTDLATKMSLEESNIAKVMYSQITIKEKILEIYSGMKNHSNILAY